MSYIICFSLACLCLALTIAFGVFLIVSKKRIKYPLLVFVLLAFFAGLFIFFPMNWANFDGEALRFTKTTLVSAHTSVILFVLNAGFDIIFDAAGALNEIGEGFRSAYNIIAAIIYVLCPILTAGFVLSLLKGFHALFRFKLSSNKEVFIFSELNKKTANLAKSIKAKKSKAVIVFCDMNDEAIEDNNELYEDLLDINIIALKSDITSLNLKHHSKDANKGVHFFLISENDEKILSQYSSLVKKHVNMENGKIYLFSRSSQSDLVFNKQSEKKIKTRKYDSDFLIIYNYLYEQGVNIFKDAKEDKDGIKQISVVIVGFGLNGKMLTKALAWYCQMDGYKLEINVYDADENAEDIFKEQAPELLNSAFANPENKEENQYVINIHGGVKVGTYKFIQEIDSIAERVTFAFTCLGDDEVNIDTAMKLRMILERHNNKSHIVSVVYSGDNEYVTGATNFKGQPYDIQCIGSYIDTYSYDFVIDSPLEKAAIGVHTRYNSSTISLFSYAYNFRSSCASAIHERARFELGINGSNLPADQLSQEQIIKIETLEHRRWSAYVRSEGYIYSSERNDLAKTHQDLILYSDLDEATKRLDSKVAIVDDEDKDEE